MSTRLLAERYEIGELIGRGGMSDVHVGIDTRLGRRVAIKLLKPSLAMDPRFRVLFREEAQKAARMAHPTIVRVFDAGEETVTDAAGHESQAPFIVMEYVDGRLLKDIIADGPLAPKEAIRIISGVLVALEYSHRALLVHRDIKPGNIMITHGGQVKVMDFGIARAISDNSATVADTTAVLGTAQYFSPEQAKGESVDARTDLYSTGVVLFELLTGQPPFRGDRAAAVAYQHISEAAVAPSSLNPAVSPAIDAVVLHALAKDKFERFQTAADFRADLEAASAGAVPAIRKPSNDFNSTLFGVNPNSPSTSEQALRQLSTPGDDRNRRTQSRPPVVFIWVGIAALAVILISVVFWLIHLPTANISVGLSITVPSVVNDNYKDASSTLTDLKLMPTLLSIPSDTVAQNLVISTDPAAGIKVPKGEQIKVYVSTGKAPATIPSLSNLTEDAAKAALTTASLSYGSTSHEHSTTLPAGIVIRSDPPSTTSARKGDAINLIVSDGLIQIPSVVGQTITAANTALSPLLLNITTVPNGSCGGGKVTSQSLTGDDRPQRSNIALTYCSGP